MKTYFFYFLDSPCSLRLLDRIKKKIWVPNDENDGDFTDENVQFHPLHTVYSFNIYTCFIFSKLLTIMSLWSLASF